MHVYIWVYTHQKARQHFTHLNNEEQAFIGMLTES